MIILGIDPGTATTGYALIKSEDDKLSLLDFGIIKTSPTQANAERLFDITKDIEKLAKKWKPEESAIEEIFFSKNVKTGIKVAQARGAIIATLARLKVGIHEYKPVEVKSSITGNGQAEKYQVKNMVKILMNMQSAPKSDDAADAIAIAICHANSYNQIRRLQSL